MSLLIYQSVMQDTDPRCNSPVHARNQSKWRTIIQADMPCNPCIQPIGSSQCCCTCFSVLVSGLKYQIDGGEYTTIDDFTLHMEGVELMTLAQVQSHLGLGDLAADNCNCFGANCQLPLGQWRGTQFGVVSGIRSWTDSWLCQWSGPTADINPFGIPSGPAGTLKTQLWYDQLEAAQIPALTGESEATLELACYTTITGCGSGFNLSGPFNIRYLYGDHRTSSEAVPKHRFPCFGGMMEIQDGLTDIVFHCSGHTIHTVWPTTVKVTGVSCDDDSSSSSSTSSSSNSSSSSSSTSSSSSSSSSSSKSASSLSSNLTSI